MPWGHIFTFFAGVLVGAATIVIWKALRFAADLRAARHALASYVFPDCGVADELAKKAVEDCKNRLRWQKNLNPEWLPPLVDEVPKLVREIAAIYHPGKPEALLAPGLSQFSRAVHLAAMDVADFLQTRSIGRLVDVSASTAIKTWEMTHKIATHERMLTVNKWYKRLLPVWQVLRFKSPVMWAGMAVSNVAARTLQPAVIDIIAKRAIDLYSGRLGKGVSAPAEAVVLPEKEPPPGAM
ncbi:MAG: hypothetical protein IAE77_21035 [Prosthecobacter sp.]|jgi:hypothetical protein|uniref:hypothetical protein n=1 Tax=Prosthecobacter sp. TaxID=1965333 RepID=UPI0019FEFF41|nr:hypothetical protein [Prosthecobacter sp.]MBE2285955.1 hypothetical protein [Prosthecobacter sp.]